MKNIRQNLCRDRILFCRDIDYCNIEILWRHKKSFEISLCHDKVMYVVTPKEEETLVVTDKQSRDM